MLIFSLRVTFRSIHPAEKETTTPPKRSVRPPTSSKKYLAASQLVADHLVLRTDGIAFAPYPVTSYTTNEPSSRKAPFCDSMMSTKSIIVVCAAAWRFRYRSEAEQMLTLEDWASTTKAQPQVSRVNLATRSIQTMRATHLTRFSGRCPEGLASPGSAACFRCEQLEPLFRMIELARHVLNSKEGELIKANAGNWPISHLDFRARTAADRDRFDASALDRQITSLSQSSKSPRQTNLNPIALATRPFSCGLILSIQISHQP